LAQQAEDIRAIAQQEEEVLREKRASLRVQQELLEVQKAEERLRKEAEALERKKGTAESKPASANPTQKPPNKSQPERAHPLVGWVAAITVLGVGGWGFHYLLTKSIMDIGARKQFDYERSKIEQSLLRKGTPLQVLESECDYGEKPTTKSILNQMQSTPAVCNNTLQKYGDAYYRNGGKPTQEAATPIKQKPNER
ncbi:MAG: hypothetical protein ACK5XX_06105, partial [Holosporales bacterium]